ncbi:MAG: hypothetical protein WCI79_00895 [Candidatus Saccharibacteria bacterium]
MNINIISNLASGMSSVTFLNDGVSTKIELSGELELDDLLKNLISACHYFISTEDLPQSHRQLYFSAHGPVDIGSGMSKSYDFITHSFCGTYEIKVDYYDCDDQGDRTGPCELKGAYSRFELSDLAQFVLLESKKTRDMPEVYKQMIINIKRYLSNNKKEI